MLMSLILAATVGAIGDEPVPVPSGADLSAYNKAAGTAGKSADAHVRLALWCEAHHLNAERMKQLALAVLYQPSNVLARGLMGLVAHHGKWDRPDVVGKELRDDPVRQALVREYLDRRARAADTADAQTKLAAWCEKNGLNEQAIVHYTAVTRINPSREAAWKQLGYQKQGGRWVKPDEAAAAKRGGAAETGRQTLETDFGEVARRAGKQNRSPACEGRRGADRGDRSANGADGLGAVRPWK